MVVVWLLKPDNMLGEYYINTEQRVEFGYIFYYKYPTGTVTEKFILLKPVKETYKFDEAGVLAMLCIVVWEQISVPTHC